MLHESRARTLARFRDHAARLLGERPDLRSAMLAIAQFWNGGDGDEVHALVVVSPRDVPMWPHTCDAPPNAPIAPVRGEACVRCGDFEALLAPEAAAFEPFCHEVGHRENPIAANYLPFAIARRGAGGALALDLVGKLLRPALDMLADRDASPRSWLELPRAPALYGLVCERLADDEPRRVLADYLLEHDEPRGEYIALALAGELDAAGRARRDELLERHGRAWLGGLAEVIPASGAHWARGFLTRADVFGSERTVFAYSAAAWRTVETIRFLGGVDVLSPDRMTALRDVGPVRGGLVDLGRARHPWAIERLHAVLDHPEWIADLWGATTLPCLTDLVLEGRYLAAAFLRSRPVWWRHLERLTLRITDQVMPMTGRDLARWREAAGNVPWLAIAQCSNRSDDPGWEVAYGPDRQIELSLGGWHEEATLTELARIVAGLPYDADLALAPSRYWAPTAGDAARVTAETGRPVHLRAR